MKVKRSKNLSESPEPEPGTDPVTSGAPPARWPSSARIAFRFAFLYLGLYAIASQIFSGLFLIFVSSPPNYSFRNLGHIPPMRDITYWVAERVFGESAPVFAGNSGDSVFYWSQILWILAFALVATLLWSLIDRRRANYDRLLGWFTVFVRITLGAQMLYYGLAKVIPTQFPAPSLVTLVTPVGNVSLQGLLWTSIGASPAYQIFTGLLEVAAGILLLIPATWVLGAAISFAVMVEILILNLTYDIGLKQISFQLLLMSAFLLIPLYSRILALFRSGWTARTPEEPAPAAPPRSNRIVRALQIALIVYLIGMYGYIAGSWWYSAGGGSAKSPLYGIWNVRRLTVDGISQNPVLNDYDTRWRRVIFDAPGDAVFQRTDDSFIRLVASVDSGRQTLALNRTNSKSWVSRFTYGFPSDDRLILDGEMDGHTIRMELDRLELDTFRINSSSFRWIRPPDPNTVPDE